MNHAKLLSMTLKTNLKRLLSEHDLTASRLSRSTGVPPATLSEWLAGTTPRDLRKVKKVADYFHVTIDELCFGGASKPKAQNVIEAYEDEINAGLFEVVLRRKKL